MENSVPPMTPAAVALPTLAFIALLLDLPPLFLHIKNHNVAAICLVVWTILENLFNFVNPILWPTDNLPAWFPGYGLCDVEVKIIVMANFGITGSLTCIMRKLAHVLDTENTTLAPSKEQRRMQRIVTAVFCFGGPLYALAVSFLIQGNRYYIFAIAGCTPSVDSSWPPLVLYVIWPPIICTVAAYYCVLVIIRMRKYHREFSIVLSASNSKFTTSRFMRLFLLSCLMLLVCFPLQIYVLYRNATAEPLVPYSWSRVHESWSYIMQIPTWGTVNFDRWLQVVNGFFIFFFFGFGNDATKMYRKWWLKLRLGTNFPSLHGQTAEVQRQPASAVNSRESLASVVFKFVQEKLSWRSSSSSSSSRNVNEAMTVTSNATALSEPEKPPSMHLTASEVGVSERPLPKSGPAAEIVSPMPAHPNGSWFRRYSNLSRSPPPSDDIESALEAHDHYAPNRFLANLYNANQHAATSLSASQGTCMGNCNGLKL